MTSSRGTAALLRTDTQRLMSWHKSHVNESTSTRWLRPRSLDHCKSHLCQHPSTSCISSSSTSSLQDKPCAAHSQILPWKPNMILAGTLGMLLVCQLHGNINHSAFVVTLATDHIEVECPHGNTNPVVYARLGCPTTDKQQNLTL